MALFWIVWEYTALVMMIFTSPYRLGEYHHDACSIFSYNPQCHPILYKYFQRTHLLLTALCHKYLILASIQVVSWYMWKWYIQSSQRFLPKKEWSRHSISRFCLIKDWFLKRFRFKIKDSDSIVWSRILNRPTQISVFPTRNQVALKFYPTLQKDRWYHLLVVNPKSVCWIKSYFALLNY